MIAAVVLAALVLAAGFSAASRAGVVLLGALSLLWLAVNGPMEGPVLVVVAPGHGLTGGDLAGLVGLGLAAGRGLQWWRGSRRPSA